MKITVVYGQNHKGSTYRIARMLAEKLDGDISEIFLPRDFGEFCVGCAKCILHDAKDCPHAESLQPITQKLDEAGYNTVEIRQHSSVLHPPTKWLKEKILKGEFAYEPNRLLEINFQNARCTYDSNMNLYVHKKKSKGKVDMVVSMINAMYLLQQDYVLGDGGVVVQVI